MIRGAISLLAILPMAAQASPLVCLFEPTNERFSIVTIERQDFIQWGSGPILMVDSRFKNGELFIQQFNELGIFQMIWNPKTSVGSGVILLKEGRAIEGGFKCAAQ